MILFTRTVALGFRALFGRCVMGRPRGPAPPVVLRVRYGERILAAITPEGVTLTHTSSAPKEVDDLIVLPASVLSEVEGGTDEDVILDRQSKLRGELRWHIGSKPQKLPVELILPGRQHELPGLPPLKPVSGPLFTALNECGRTAAKENGRFALSRVQIRGQQGRVIGTDGKVAIVWGGFTFPFADDVLVPALPVFGAKPFARVEEAKIGRTGTHLVVVAGPWSVWLPTDTTAKYPDVASVIPRNAPTTVVIDGPDAAALLPVLPGLPGSDHEHRPVTLDVNGGVRVRGEKAGVVQDVPLAGSMSAGPAMRVALDRRVLARALSLGCRTWKLTPDKAVVAEGDDITFVAAPLDPDALASPATNDPPALPPASVGTPIPTTLERNPPMKPETNGHPARDEPPDPLALAEDLRDALADAATKAARLVSALRQSKKEKRVLASVLTGLKQLNLGTNGGPK